MSFNSVLCWGFMWEELRWMQLESFNAWENCVLTHTCLLCTYTASAPVPMHNKDVTVWESWVSRLGPMPSISLCSLYSIPFGFRLLEGWRKKDSNHLLQDGAHLVCVACFSWIHALLINIISCHSCSLTASKLSAGYTIFSMKTWKGEGKVGFYWGIIQDLHQAGLLHLCL